ncbi:hypothetical protein ACFX2I_011393 [Malus domestica]
MDKQVEANPSSSPAKEREDEEGGGMALPRYFEDRARAIQFPTFNGKHKLVASISHLQNQIDIIQNPGGSRLDLTKQPRSTASCTRPPTTNFVSNWLLQTMKIWTCLIVCARGLVPTKNLCDAAPPMVDLSPPGKIPGSAAACASSDLDTDTTFSLVHHPLAQAGRLSYG